MVSKEEEKKNEAVKAGPSSHENAKELLLKIKAECEKQKKTGLFKVSELGDDILGEKFVDVIQLGLGDDFVLKEDLARKIPEIEKYLAA